MNPFFVNDLNELSYNVDKTGDEELHGPTNKMFFITENVYAR